MHEIAFYIGSRGIHWYGVCIAVGFLAALWIMVRQRAHAGMTKDHVFDITMIAMFAGIIGARIFHVLQFWNTTFSRRPFVEVFRIDKGGLVFYGGFILAIICVCLYARRKKISIVAMLDVMAPAISIGHAFGRIGCFMQGCCHGKPAPAGFWGAVRFPHGSQPWHTHPGLDGMSLPLYPVQLYEAAANILFAGLLLYLLRRTKRKGMIAGVYLIGYAVIRFCMEFFRGDHNPADYALGMTPSQNIALFVMFPLGMIVIFIASTIRTNFISPDSKGDKKHDK